MYTIWGRPHCVWCEAAKKFLSENNEEYTYVELDHTNLYKFGELTNGAKTVPQIFDPFSCLIGGYEDLVEFYKTRK